MATMVKLGKEQDSIIEEAYKRINEAEENRQIEYESVVKVQAWFRAQRVRKYLWHLDHSAVAIQRRWRGYMGRKKCRQLLKDQVFIMKLNDYNAMATKVQKVWRGYYTRKYQFNYHSRKRYLNGLRIKNEIIRQELEEFEEQQDLMTQIKQDDEFKKKLDNWSEKHHHLVSTEVIPGVFNSPYQRYPNEIEFHLRNAKPNKTSPRKEKKGSIYDPTWKRYDLPKLEPLPPIHDKPQGPFREPRAVQRQRYKPFQPTLRVATDFYALESARQHMKDEEWVTRLNDDTFVPFKKRESKEYEPLLHSSSKYGHLSYGTRFFREEYMDKFLLPQNFQTVVAPIPILEKLNDTYSQGQA